MEGEDWVMFVVDTNPPVLPETDDFVIEGAAYDAAGLEHPLRRLGCMASVAA